MKKKITQGREVKDDKKMHCEMKRLGKAFRRVTRDLRAPISSMSFAHCAHL